MNQDIDNVESPNTYSVPRQFGLPAIFAGVTLMAIAIAVVRAMNLDDESIIDLVAITLAVAVGQAVLFGGRRPRLASVIAGACMAVVVEWAGVLWLKPTAFFHGAAGDLLPSLPLTALAGAVGGYIAGAVLGGMFLVLDKLQHRLRS